MSGNNFWVALSMTMIAGLSTGLGGVIALFGSKSRRFLPIALGMSAGVMIYVSFVELFQEAQNGLCSLYGEQTGGVLTALGFFLGVMLIFVVDQLLPEEINPREKGIGKRGAGKNARNEANRLGRVGIITALGIVIHNFPEGIATFASAMKDPRLGLAVSAAVAMHNIPEGIAVAVPMYYATGSKSTAVKAALFSGLAEPLGALAAMVVLWRFMSDTLYGMLMAAVAGIMVFISLDELLPTAQAYGEHHLSIIGLIAGMAVMAVTLLVL